jgi:sugar lactone lactonase YvrE
MRSSFNPLTTFIVLVSTALCVPSSAHAQLQWFAGSPAGDGNADGPVVQASFGHPLVHADQDNRILIADNFASTLRSIDASDRVETLAGHSGWDAMANGAAKQALFNDPLDAVRGPDGRIYIADSNNRVIRTLSPDGAVATFAGIAGERGDADGGPGKGQLNDPDKLAFDASGRLWVLDTYSKNLRIVTQDGTISTWAPACGDDCSGLDWMQSATMLAAAPDKTIWIGDSTHIGRVAGNKFEIVIGPKPEPEKPVAVSPSGPPEPGPVSELIGKVPFLGREPVKEPDTSEAAETELAYRAMAFDRAGVLYVATSRGLQRLPAGSQQMEEMPVTDKDHSFEWDKIDSLAVADDGRILLTGDSEAILQIRDGVLQPYAGVDSHQREGELNGKRWTRLHGSIDDSIVMAPDGTLYFADRLDDAIYRITPDGHEELWAGKPDDEGGSDDTRLQARFRFPTSLALDAKGNLFVADAGNARIRVITPEGQVLTVTGHSSDESRQDGDFKTATFWHPSYMSFDRQQQLLYILDDSPYTRRGEAYIRVLDMANHTVRTVARERQIKNISPEELNRLAMVRRWNVVYRDLTVGPDNELYVLADDVVWRIDPKSGEHHIYFLPEAGSQLEASRYQPPAGAMPKSDSDDPFRNDLIACDWLWCSPNRLVADAQGNLYVSDDLNSTVLRIDTKGNTAIIAGQPGLRGYVPGALPGVLNRPSCMIITPGGDLLMDMNTSGLMLLPHPAEAPAQKTIPPAPPSVSLKGVNPDQ